MTDELKQEAEEKYFNHKMADFQGFYNRHYYCLGYLESAEPREKRIAELEKENTELRAKLDKINDYLANEIPHELINDATNKIWRLL